MLLGQEKVSPSGPAPCPPTLLQTHWWLCKAAKEGQQAVAEEDCSGLQQPVPGGLWHGAEACAGRGCGKEPVLEVGCGGEQRSVLVEGCGIVLQPETLEGCGREQLSVSPEVARRSVVCVGEGCGIEQRPVPVKG